MADATALRLALHPWRKRKFFTDLAHLLDEDPPEIRPLHSAFYGPYLSDQCRVVHESCSSPNNATQSQLVPSHSVTSDSYESVEFGVQGTGGINSVRASQQSSHHESVANSLLFLPENSNTNAGSSQKRPDCHVQLEIERKAKRDSASRDRSCEALPVTTLVNSGMMSEKPHARARLELIDYYDIDRMCEPSPCWLQSGGARSCKIHQGTIRRPMLLFCLQTLDEVIARNEWLGQQRWRVQACKVARRVFTAMWETDMLGIAPLEQDIAVTDCVTMKTGITGVARDVWRIIARYWDKYKQNCHHQQELYLADVSEGSLHTADKWAQVRALLQIYGMKPSQAMRVVDEHDSEHLNYCRLTDKQLQAVAFGFASIQQLQTGMDYLKCKVTGTSVIDNEDLAMVQRPMICQQDAKTAFHAICIHLEKWNERVQVFPCGSFSRGAAFISVLDVLVVVPISEANGTCVDIDEKLFHDVVGALTAAQIVPKGSMRRLATTRGACIIPFKTSSILLDLKVYCSPRSWFALLYFTGPEKFVVTFFTDFLKRSLRAIPDTSFECIYSCVTEVIGSQALSAIECEKDLFDFIGREFLQPADRI